MNNMQPIRNAKDIKIIKEKLLESSVRDYMLFNIGINTGLRISDMLHLKAIDVRNQQYLTIIEQKTSKKKKILLRNPLIKEINKYIIEMKDNDYLFQSRKGDNKPITRQQAYRILNDAAEYLNIKEIGTHTLRKTFGYHFYKKTNDIALLMELFNHSSQSITLRYIGINQDSMDEQLKDFNL
jgi:site-specific recombinase XerD